MGLPVLVMEMSEAKRLPAMSLATLRADRTADRGEAILAIGECEARMVGVPPDWPWFYLFRESQVFGDGRASACVLAEDHVPYHVH